MSYTLPNVGDLIRFTKIWDLDFYSDNSPNENRSPIGVVTSIEEYNTLEKQNDEKLIGTLAYPLTILDSNAKTAQVFVIHWASDNKEFCRSYRLINEEWFWNGSFIVVSRTNKEKE